MNGVPGTDILSRMKSKILTSFQQLPNLDASKSSVHDHDGSQYITNNTQTQLPVGNSRASHGRSKSVLEQKFARFSRENSQRSISGRIFADARRGSFTDISDNDSDVDRYVAIGKGSSKLQIMTYQQD